MTRRPVCLVCLFLMLCMCLADLAGVPLIRGTPLPETVQTYIKKHPDSVICGEVQRCQATEFSFSVYLKQVVLICRSEKIPIENVRVFLKTEEELPAGTAVCISGKLEQVEAPRNPGEFDSRQYYACQHIYYFMKNGIIKRKSRAYSGYQQFLLELKDRIHTVLKLSAGRDAPVFEAMLLGEKSELDQDLKLRYQMAGMVHILAISGLHISILGMGLFSLLKRIGLGNAGAGLVSLCVMLQYGMLTGGSVSAMRAVCMFVLNVGARVLGRTYDLMTALALSAIFLLLDSPAYLYSSSFLLSFGAVVGLGAVSPHLIRITGAKGKAGKALISSLSVQAATLPVMLVFFGEVSVIGILLNLFVLPTVGGVLISGLCCSVLGLFSVNAGRAAAVPGRILLWLYEKVCMFAGKLPFCTWIGGLPEIWQSISYYLLLASGIILAYVMASGIQKKEENQLAVGKKVSENSDKIRGVFRKAAKRVYPAGIFLLAAAAGIFVLSRKPGKELRITCLDIGQGDGIVLEIPDGGVFLMDCGSSNKKNTAQYQLLPYLKSRGISHINGIMISHTDKDHISGIMELLEFMEQGLTSVRSDALILPDWEEPPEVYNTLIHLAQSAGMKVLQVECGNSFRMGEAGFHILAPAKDALGEDVNEEGMVVELEYREFRGLFTGDAGEPAEKAILNRLRDVDFLKVGHHGSRYSSCREFLDQVKAEVAVISCSDSNTYGHPSPETTLRLKKSGAKTEFTMKSGAVSVCTDGKRMWVQRFLEE